MGAGGYAVGDPVGDRSSLAGTGSRDDCHRSAERGRDLSLLGVETVEQRVGRKRSRRGCRHRDTIRALTDYLRLLAQVGSGYANSISVTLES